LFDEVVGHTKPVTAGRIQPRRHDPPAQASPGESEAKVPPPLAVHLSRVLSAVRRREGEDGITAQGPSEGDLLPADRAREPGHVHETAQVAYANSFQESG
jgi:hypothetical protein